MCVDGSRVSYTRWNDMETNNSGGKEDCGHVMSMRGEEDGMTDLVRLYLCELRSKPGEAVVGARAVSLQRFSLGVFEFIADHSFAFVHCQVVVGNATALGFRCTKKCSSSDRRNRTIADDEHGPYHSLTRLTRQKARLL